ncbi:RagB/SusD family nutrient uptake outer membrane protein [Sphingobacterium sp. Mn56C]|uniref:RagB/SusD family nutrient uptake outer membrane protein n=1 Tax=Sphingobacterium sp. Mn56C TaxID=3395261 RepID=UPI003BD0610E
MKTTFIKILALFFVLALGSCRKLDLEPLGMLDEKALFGNEEGARKYVAGLYSHLPIEDFVYHPERGFRWDNYWQNSETFASMSGEMTGQFWGVAGAQGFGYWPYDKIRNVNTYIAGLPNHKDNYTEDAYNNTIGEAHFLRAFFYFALVKRYGGVPIIKEVQDPRAEKETLLVPRDKEVDVYKFIYDDLQFAIENMQKISERGRANKYVAAALLSRVMLYAGSVAKYGFYSNLAGDASVKGFVGIPKEEAEWFYQKAYDAATVVLDGPYTLYNKNPDDKVLNYVNLFLDAESTEDIFIKQYDITGPHNSRLKHSYDATHLPNPTFSSDNESAAYPVLNVVELFGELPITAADGKPIRYASRKDLYANLEPRLQATVYFSGMELRDGAEKREFDMQRGLYVSFPGLASDAQMGAGGAPVNSESNRILAGPKNAEHTYNGTKFLITGEHGMWKDGHANNTRSGFYVRKYINYKMSSKEVKLYNSTQPWKVIRLAEVLLNKAEAAYELGLLKNNETLKTEAFTYIARIRERAGAKPYVYNSGPVVGNKYGYPIDGNLQFIREERERELCFENHHWWDMRRWRIADVELNNFVPNSLMPYLVLDEVKYKPNGERIGSYIFIREREPWNKSFTFEKKWYYEPLPGGELNKNPLLYPQNPIY